MYEMSTPSPASGPEAEGLMRSSADLAMQRYAAGDDCAFAELYDLLGPRLYGFLLRQLGDRARAEDLVQQTFLQVHRARGRFTRGAEVLPWAFAIARRLMIDALRRGEKELVAKDNAGSALWRTAATADQADELLEAKELAARVHAELARLPENQRLAFVLVRQEGLSLAHAAQVLGTTIMGVKLRLHRASEALRASLGKGFDPEPQRSVNFERSGE